MKTVFNPNHIVTGALAFWKAPPWSFIGDTISFLEVARYDGPIKGLDGLVHAPSHCDVLEVKDNGTIFCHGMSWPKKLDGEYYYHIELTQNCVSVLHEHLVGVAVNPDLVRNYEFQDYMAAWLKAEKKKHYQYGVENLFRDLALEPADPTRPVCAMFDTFALLTMQRYGSQFSVPALWTVDWNQGPDTIMNLLNGYGWLVPFERQVPDEFEPNAELTE